MSKTLRRTTATTASSLLLAAAWLLGFPAAIHADSETAQTLHEQALRLTHENACARAEAELAKADRFYLVLDPEQRSLALKLRGALLREISLYSIEVGRPHRFFIERDTRIHVRGQLHRQGRLAPQRPLLRFPVDTRGSSDEETQTIMLPPEPETAIAVPRRFFVSYPDGVVLEFRTGEGGPGLGRRIADRFSALFGRPELRLYLVLDRAAAEAFYRAVPPETDLLVK